ncbi:acetyltransferase [Roseobacter sp.]|uniref:acetyltransferase n=1 Tax=Roseobacter sp. TaxID=1907202 RepID=UPI00385960AF
MNDQPKRLYVDHFGTRHKAARAIWVLARVTLFRTTPGPLFKGWRRFLLRCFGATIGRGCRVDASCRIWSPKNLKMGDFSCLADGVDCYNVAPITIGDYATVSQRSFLCSASHETHTLKRGLIFAPIAIGKQAWVCAEAYVGPGICIGDGAILGARAVATRDLDKWSIYAGNPARRLSAREIDQ